MADFRVTPTFSITDLFSSDEEEPRFRGVIRPVFDPTLFGLLPQTSSTSSPNIPVGAEGLFSPEQIQRLNQRPGSRVLETLAIIGALLDPQAGQILGGISQSRTASDISERDKIISNALDLAKAKYQGQLSGLQLKGAEEEQELNKKKLQLEEEKFRSSTAPISEELRAQFGLPEGITADQLRDIASIIVSRKGALSTLGKLQTEREALLGTREAYKAQIPEENIIAGKKDPTLAYLDQRIEEYNENINKETTKSENEATSMLDKLERERDKRVAKLNAATKSGDRGKIAEANQEVSDFDTRILREIQGTSNEILETVITLATKNDEFNLSTPDKKIDFLKYFVAVAKAIRSDNPEEELSKIKKPKSEEETITGKITDTLKDLFKGKPKVSEEITVDLLEKEHPAKNFPPIKGVNQIFKDLKTGKRFESDGTTWKEIK